MINRNILPKNSPLPHFPQIYFKEISSWYVIETINNFHFPSIKMNFSYDNLTLF